MANQLASNPWLIDTTSANVLHDAMMPHIQIEYAGYGTTPAMAEVQDRNGRTIALLEGLATGETVRTGRMGWVQGIKVPPTLTAGGTNLTAGRLILYFE